MKLSSKEIRDATARFQLRGGFIKICPPVTKGKGLEIKAASFKIGGHFRSFNADTELWAFTK